MAGERETAIRLIVGLGNPGPEYAGTRHNAGFMTVAALMQAIPGTWEERHRCESRIMSGRFAGRKVIFQLPETFMNESGKAVAPLCRAEGIEPEEVLVICDDMDLPVGRIRMRRGGSAGGHHGVESVMNELGSGAFLRLRLGIGHGRNGVEHVLGRFSEEEAPVMRKTIAMAVEAVQMAFRRGEAFAMNQYNGRDADQVREPGTADGEKASLTKEG